MKVREHNTDFYESLAHLFYAMAVVDKRVSIKEKLKIKELIDKDWSLNSHDINSRDVIFSTLKRLFKEDYDTEEAFLKFKRFFLDHRKLFSEELKKRVMYAANEIAIAFAGLNKSESVLISRLYFLMWK